MEKKKLKDNPSPLYRVQIKSPEGVAEVYRTFAKYNDARAFVKKMKEQDKADKKTYTYTIKKI